MDQLSNVLTHYGSTIKCINLIMDQQSNVLTSSWTNYQEKERKSKLYIAYLYALYYYAYSLFSISKYVCSVCELLYIQSDF